ncbi:MAG TPA: sugar phosphate nucleotidyltransferase [Rubricoccaceae bacterium]|jgi:glucose-1-phosphate thymidylyltransferase
MKLIVPMAGRGTRLRPHTHVTPKPLLPVAGTPMVERIIETFVAAFEAPFAEAVFILGPDFGQEVRDSLTAICARHGIDAHFAVQETALGTAHAVASAGEHLAGEVVVVFADTLFTMDRVAPFTSDAVIWVQTVEDPSRFGVVVKDGDRITDFVEKPDTPISNEAIVGIYYIRDGATLKREVQYLLDHEVTGKGGEYQITDAFDRMLKAGQTFTTASVSEWLDCGTIPALMETSAVVLGQTGQNAKRGTVDADSTLVEPVFMGAGAVVRGGSTVGPNVSLEAGAVVDGSTLTNSIVFANGTVTGSVLDNALVGHHAAVSGFSGTLNIGDHATVGPV